MSFKSYVQAVRKDTYRRLRNGCVLRARRGVENELGHDNAGRRTEIYYTASVCLMWPLTTLQRKKEEKAKSQRT
jgi:hypothetical protein